jgi:hypothetical protein
VAVAGGRDGGDDSRRLGPGQTELARKRVYSPPLGRVEVCVERDEQRDGSGDDVSDRRAGIRRATAAREQQRDRTEKEGDPAG